MTYLPDRRVLFLVAIAGLAVVSMAQAQEPSVRVLSPENGGVVDGRNVELRMEVQGVKLTPRQSSNAAYVLLRLDDAPPVKAYADSFTFQDVSPGSHLVRVELRRNNGGAFSPPVRTQVRFTVRAERR